MIPELEYAFVFKDDKLYFADDIVIKIYDIKKNKVFDNYIKSYHIDNISCITSHPTKNFLYTCSWDNTINEIDLYKNKTCRGFIIRNPDNNVLFSVIKDVKDNIFTCSDNINSAIIKINNAAVTNNSGISSLDITSIKSDTTVIGMLYIEEQEIIYTWSRFDNNLTGWHFDSGQKIVTMKGHTKNINCACLVNSDPPLIATASDDHSIKIWNTTENKCINTLRDSNSVDIIASAPDGIHVISFSKDFILKIWNIFFSECIQSINFDKCIIKIAISPNGSRLALGVYDKLQIYTIFPPYSPIFLVKQGILKSLDNFKFKLYSDGILKYDQKIFTIINRFSIIKKKSENENVIEINNKHIGTSLNLNDWIESFCAVSNYQFDYFKATNSNELLYRYRFDIFQIILAKLEANFLSRNLLEIINFYIFNF